jgi:tetrahydromethanopterin S-methyltransferase subunit G
MDRKYRVEDHRVQADELERIAAKLDAVELELVRSQRSHHSLLGASRDQSTDQFHRIISRLDALDAAVEALAAKPAKPSSPWWFRRR